MRPRVVWRAVLLLLLGAAVNVLVAWTLAVTVNPLAADFRGADTGRLERKVGMWARSGSVLLSSWRTSANLTGISLGWSEPRRLTVEEMRPSWCPLNESTEAWRSWKYTDELRHFEARGWPMLTLWAETRRELTSWNYRSRQPTTESSAHGVILLPLDAWSFRRRGEDILGVPAGWIVDASPKGLPLRPIWLGFAANTVFYAAVLWLLLFMPLGVRRWRRKSRGRCVQCGYDLRGVASARCSECGAAR